MNPTIQDESLTVRSYLRRLQLVKPKLPKGYLIALEERTGIKRHRIEFSFRGLIACPVTLEKICIAAEQLSVDRPKQNNRSVIKPEQIETLTKIVELRPNLWHRGIKEIAEKAHVSAATVSTAFGGKPISYKALPQIYNAAIELINQRHISQ